MIVLRRARVSRRCLSIRQNSSLQTATLSSSSDQTATPPPPAAPTDQPAADSETKKPVTREWKTRRPHISPKHPRKWHRALASGVLPAYDEALRLIQEDSATLQKEAHYYRITLKREEEKPDRDHALVEELKDKLNILEIQSQVNRPDVRWMFRNGLADMSLSVYRHLADHKWRKEGDLDLLMERIHQMNVVPDVLPSLHPSFELRLTFPEPPPRSVYLRTRVKRQYKQVEPGIYLLPEQTRKPPRLYTSVFHPETRLYTLLMVDPDVPDTVNQTFQTYLHWMQPNIALSALSESPIPLLNNHTRYIPPHPQQGTPYHRYVILLLPQSSPTERISVPVLTDAERLGFNVREFMGTYSMDGSKGGAAHMWRESWDESVSSIYEDILKMEEPRFVVPPRPDRYADIRDTERYIK